MKRIPSDFVLPAIRFCLHRPIWLLAPLAAAAATPAAAAPGPCPDKGWDSHSTTGYSFVYFSGRRADKPQGYVHCVRNTGNGVLIDWRGSGLKSPIPRGQLIYTTGSAPFRHKTQRFFYGARKSWIEVPTAARVALFGTGGSTLGARSGAGPFARALAWKPAAAPVESSDNEALLYLPTDPSLLTELARGPWSLRKVIERLEAAQLHPFGMTFANRVAAGPDGRLTVAWECRYILPKLQRSGRPLFRLRFSDRDLHRRMFGRSDPEPVTGYGGEAEIKAQLPPLEPGQLATRAAKLEVLLGNSKIVLAAIPISFSGPRG